MNQTLKPENWDEECCARVLSQTLNTITTALEDREAKKIQMRMNLPYGPCFFPAKSKAERPRAKRLMAKRRWIWNTGISSSLFQFLTIAHTRTSWRVTKRVRQRSLMQREQRSESAAESQGSCTAGSCRACRLRGLGPDLSNEHYPPGMHDEGHNPCWWTIALIESWDFLEGLTWAWQLLVFVCSVKQRLTISWLRTFRNTIAQFWDKSYDVEKLRSRWIHSTGQRWVKHWESLWNNSRHWKAIIPEKGPNRKLVPSRHIELRFHEGLVPIEHLPWKEPRRLLRTSR